MATLSATTKIYTREAPLSNRAIKGVFQRKDLRQTIGLAPQKQLHPINMVTWAQVISTVAQTDKTMAQDIKRALIASHTKLGTEVIIRDAKLTSTNVYDLLQRSELRSLARLEPLSKNSFEARLGEVLEHGLDTKGVETQDALIANYFVSWYGILENPTNIEALKQSPYLEVSQRFLMECFERSQSQEPSTVQIETPIPQTPTQLAQTIYLRTDEKNNDPIEHNRSVRMALERTEIRLVLGLDPKVFNYESQQYIFGHRTIIEHPPLTIQRILETAGIDPAPYPSGILEKNIWIRNITLWRYQSDQHKTQIAKEVLKRASLCQLLGLPLIEHDSETIFLSQAIKVLAPSNRESITIQTLQKAGFYSDPSLALNILIQKARQGHQAKKDRLTQYLAHYLIMVHFSKEKCEPLTVTQDLIKYLQLIAPDNYFEQGRLAAQTAKILFGYSDIRLKYYVPYSINSNLPLTRQFLYFFGLCLDPTTLPSFFAGFRDHNEYDSTLNDYILTIKHRLDQKTLTLAQLPEMIEQYFACMFQGKKPITTFREAGNLLKVIFLNKKDLAQCLTALKTYPRWQKPYFDKIVEQINEQNIFYH